MSGKRPTLHLLRAGPEELPEQVSIAPQRLLKRRGHDLLDDLDEQGLTLVVSLLERLAERQPLRRTPESSAPASASRLRDR